MSKLCLLLVDERDTEAQSLDALREASKSSDSRMVRVEAAIVDIRSAVQRSDEQFATILVKLDILPRVTTMMESFGQAIACIVPRAEVETRLKSAEERLRLVEQDERSPGRS